MIRDHPLLLYHAQVIKMSMSRADPDYATFLSYACIPLFLLIVYALIIIQIKTIFGVKDEHCRKSS